MKKLIILSIVALLQGPVAFGAIFRYESTISDGDTLLERSYKDKTIEIVSDTSERLRIFGKNYLLDTPVSFVKTGPDRWEEHYLVTMGSRWDWFRRNRPYGFHGNMPYGRTSNDPDGRTYYNPYPSFEPLSSDEVVELTLCKSFAEGVGAIRIKIRGGVGKPDKTFLFHPVEGERVAVTWVPPVFINSIKMANVMRHGTVNNDNGSFSDLDSIKIRIIYQTIHRDKEVALHFDVINKLSASSWLVDKQSRQGYTYPMPVNVSDSAGTVTYEMKLWKPEQLPIGCWLEISAEGHKLCSTLITMMGSR